MNRFRLNFAALLVVLCCVLQVQAELSWLRISGDSIVNENSERVTLKGFATNIASQGEWVAGLSDSLDAIGKNTMIPPDTLEEWSLRDVDFENLKEIGINCIRYQVNHELFADTNSRKEENMSIFLKHIKRFNDSGIYVLIDLHYMIGLDVPATGAEDDLHGDLRVKSIFEDDNYWEAHCDWWRYVIKEVKDMPGVVGFAPWAEPRVPCDAEGGLEKFTRRCNEMCQVIRDAGSEQIIFMPMYDSWEVNPGESYWNHEGKWVVDSGEQGIKWGGEFVIVDSSYTNVMYVFQFYTTSTFTMHDFTTGKPTPTFSKADMESFIKGKAAWAKENGNLPVMVIEYGCSRAQPVDKRLDWLETAHALFAEQKFSSINHLHKDNISVYSDHKWTFGLWVEYLEADQTMKISNDSTYEFYPYYMDLIQSQGFDTLIAKYFWDNGKINNPSLTYNQPIYDHFKAYFTDSLVSVVEHKGIGEKHAITPQITGRTVTFILPQSVREGQVQIVDLKGREMCKASIAEGGQQCSVALPFARGIYLVKLSGEGLNKTWKVTVR